MSGWRRKFCGVEPVAHGAPDLRWHRPGHPIRRDGISIRRGGDDVTSADNRSREWRTSTGSTEQAGSRGSSAVTGRAREEDGDVSEPTDEVSRLGFRDDRGQLHGILEYLQFRLLRVHQNARILL